MKEFIKIEQFMDQVSQDLRLFLLDKMVDNSDKLAILANKYNAIRGFPPNVLSTVKTESQAHQSNKTVGIANQQTK